MVQKIKIKSYQNKRNTRSINAIRAKGEHGNRLMVKWKHEKGTSRLSVSICGASVNNHKAEAVPPSIRVDASLCSTA